MTTTRKQSPSTILGSSASSSASASIFLVLLVLGLLHALTVVQSFTTSLPSTPHQKKQKDKISSTVIIRPSSAAAATSNRRSTNSQSLLSEATSWYYGALPSVASASSSASAASSSSSALRSATLEEPPTADTDTAPATISVEDLRGKDGLYHITNQEEYRALLAANPDKLIVLKVFAPWCRACKGLAPKFQQLSIDKKYDNLPMVWASLNIQGNKDFIKSIGVLALPTVQFYAGQGLRVDTFPCGPSKVPILKKKLVQFVNEHVDAKTRQLKQSVATDDEEEEKDPAQEAQSTTTTTRTTVGGSSVNATLMYPSATTPQEGEETVQEVIEREKNTLKGIKYISDLLESEFEAVIAKANLLTFEAGSVVMREGNPGRTFYMLLDGEVEICQRTSFEDPLTTHPSYLGMGINQYSTKGDYFGERSLITGEVRAASIRAITRTTCLSFDKADFPVTSVLSGSDSTSGSRLINKEKAIEEVNEKYGVDGIEQFKIVTMYNDTRSASQVRGSVNTPNNIAGVDDDAEMEAVERDRSDDDSDDPIEAGAAGAVDNAGVMDPSELGVGTETMVPLLMRLKLIRSITRCFDYTQKFNLKFGDPGSRRRRNILLQTLSPMQRTYIDDAFMLIDEDQTELISLVEIKRIVDSIGVASEIGLDSDDKILDMIVEDDSAVTATEETTTTAPGNYAPWQKDTSKSTMNSAQYTKMITKEDFYGLMAESETYQLFLDTFVMLDHNDSGFVRAKDLDRILCGVRDLITEDKKSIIDVEDDDMMVDYEQFSRMLVGTPLRT